MENYEEKISMAIIPMGREIERAIDSGETADITLVVSVRSGSIRSVRVSTEKTMLGSSEPFAALAKRLANTG